MKDEKTKVEGSTSLAYTGLHGELKQHKIETRLTNTKFENVMVRFESVKGECGI
jgi:hypothetical protein